MRPRSSPAEAKGEVRHASRVAHDASCRTLRPTGASEGREQPVRSHWSELTMQVRTRSLISAGRCLAQDLPSTVGIRR